MKMNKPSPLKAYTPQTSTTGNSASVTNRDWFIDDCEVLNPICRPTFVLEKHITVVRKAPTAPPLLEMYPFEEGIEQINVDEKMAIVDFSFTGAKMFQSSNHASVISPPPLNLDADGNYINANVNGNSFDGQDVSIFYTPSKELVKAGDSIHIPIDFATSGVDWEVNDQIIIEHEFVNSFGHTKKATVRLQITETSNPGPITLDASGSPIYQSATNPLGQDWGMQWIQPDPSFPTYYQQPETCVKADVMSITGNFPMDGTKESDLYNIFLVQKPPLFEVKFPKFAYRYKYEDGEYSVFGPWSEIAFIPGQFDYLPKKGYNLGMQNNLRALRIKNWVPKNIPKDVIQVDILYKESNSPNIYTLSSHKEKDPVEDGATLNYWNRTGTGGHGGDFKIKSELIHKVVASNQMLRPWDNVPRKALGQEITANRLIFANYVQNFDLIDSKGLAVKTVFSPSIDQNDFTMDSGEIPGSPAKSLKSMRTYQLGIVYRDRYGRETPVLTSKSGSIKLPKTSAKLQNRLGVQMLSEAPYWAESYTFYIKETSNEYYNLAMDRWYDAEDGGVWLSFPSSERNKISDRTNLILKKQHDTNVFTDFETKYKILSIKDNAPTFIKTDNKYWGSLPMMLPPPGWGGGTGKVGNWDAGMFYNTGLPLPNRMYIDIYAEYWDQSSLAELSSMAGAQIRVIQSAGQASAFNSTTSDTTNKTLWYDISKIAYIGSPPQTETIEVGDGGSPEVFTTTTQELPGQVEQLVRISLEKAFGNDALFCEPDDNLSLSRGLSLEARTKSVKDKSQFEGRFFVKILRDANIEQNIIQPQQQREDDFQILMSRKLKYINFAQPGVQDWSNKVITTAGVVQTGRANYIPVGLDASSNNLGFSNLGINEELYGSTPGIPYASLVSSLSQNHANTGAHYNEHDNTTIVSFESTPTGHPDGTSTVKLWPWGPGIAAVGAFNDSWYKNTFDDYIFDISGQTPFWPPWQPLGSTSDYTWVNADVAVPAVDITNTNYTLAGSTIHDWPSYPMGQWDPYSDIYDTAVSPNSTEHATPNGANTLATGPYTDRVAQNMTTRTSLRIDLSTNTFGYVPVANSPSDNNFLHGANPYHLPAIWGDQTDFHDQTGALAFPLYDAGTIVKLREDWFALWYGRDEQDPSWPLGRFSPQRWIIDKCGAAKGYAGNGIWDDGNVGYMDISFWGIGTTQNHSGRQQTLEEIFTKEHPNELGFADAISTPGTQFRFKYDPDQIVYTITAIKRSEVWNYEAPQGVWGVSDGGSPPVISSGANIGKNTAAPWGGTVSGPLVNAPAYVSDLFSNSVEMTGGAPQNRRHRWTLTLDKIIGAEGVHGFNPIKNHVDKDGKANIERGRAQYHTGIPIARAEKGGLPSTTAIPAPEWYNLASYWNSTNNGAAIVGNGDGQSEQPDTVDLTDASNYYTRNPHAYIGLHERGLNDTEIQIVTPYKGEDKDIPMSNNPAIWETEPMEDVGLDLYYAASPTYPVNLVRYRHDYISSTQGIHGPDDLDFHGANWYDYSLRGEEVVKVGSKVEIISAAADTTANPMIGDPVVCHVQGDIVWLTSTNSVTGSAYNWNNAGVIEKQFLQDGDTIRFVWQGEGTWYGPGKDDEYIEFEIAGMLSPTCYRIKKYTHGYKRGLGYFNCWSYGTGVESNRIRDDFNAVTIDKGVKASMPLATPYEEERRSSGLIFSGIYNSTSGVNNTNQFIQAEPITKDLNPINGSIQKLFARDTDLVTFCENKVFKILAKKDALFNADGNAQLTGNNNVLGQTIPFSGEFGISQNPESFAAESYRLYFTDKSRGAVLRLSRDGLTPISEAGMRDWFKDNLKSATSLIGSHDDRDDQYNLTIETKDQDGNEKAYTLSYTESKRGWVSFKSFIHQGGISHKNIYYSSPSNKYGKQTTNDPWGINYNVPEIGRGEMWQHALDLIIKRPINGSVNNNNQVVVDDGVGTIIAGMVVEGNGVPVDVTVNSVTCNSTSCTVILSKSCFLEDGEILKFTTARNSFYGNADHYSMIKVLFNGAKGVVKRFKTLDYEGTQAKTNKILDNNYELEGINVGQIYYDNFAKKGWYAANIETDMQDGKISEFIDKENKWFNYIRGKEDAGIHDNVDTGEFSLQGLGFTSTNIAYTESYDCSGSGGGCYDPGTGNGTYSNINDCLSACGNVSTTFNCVQGACLPDYTGNGTYTTIVDCQTACGTVADSWNCENGICNDPGTGQGTYTSLSACQAACVNGGGGGYTNGWDCVDVGDGNSLCGPNVFGLGQYPSQSACLSGGCCYYGCTDDSFDAVTGQYLATNYNLDATCDDGSCLYNGGGDGSRPEILGCMDSNADNYNSLATIDDGSCTYTQTSTFNCDPDAGCIIAVGLSGQYTSLSSCNAYCGAMPWECDGNTCVQIPGGQYPDMGTCLQDGCGS